MRDSPSASAILSPAKRRVLSELTAARKVIKNKYKQAYTNRTKLERDSKEIFKPILASINDLKPSEKAKKLKIKKEKIKKEKATAAAAAAAAAVAPNSLDLAVPSTSHAPAQQSILRAPVLPSTSHSAPLLPMPSDDDEDDDDDESDNDNDDDDALFSTAKFEGTASTPRKIIPITKAKKRQLTFEESPKKGDAKRARVGTTRKSQIATLIPTSCGKSPVLTLMPTRMTRSQARKSTGTVDESRYTYEVVSDCQDLRNYYKPLSDRAPVNVKQTSDYSGKSKTIRMLWGRLPKHVQNAWTKQRKHVYDLFKDSLRKKEGNMEVDTTPKKQARKRNKRTNYYVQQLKKKRAHEDDPDFMDYSEAEDVIIDGAGVGPLDFNFIPYNMKNRVVYEYFDDPNELCDRLRLLISSRMAGNSNHMQEINSIIEELRELKCIA